MLQLQNLANIWRRSSLAVVMEDYEAAAKPSPTVVVGWSGGSFSNLGHCSKVLGNVFCRSKLPRHCL